MSSSAVTPQRAIEDVNALLSYIDCALSHPRPLPEGTHGYHSTLHASQDLKDLYHCLYKLYTEDASSIHFREPVNALTYNAFTYYQVIRQPMSIREVLDNLSRGHYTSLATAEADVTLIWQNAIQFNGPTSSIAREAEGCQAALKQLREDLENDKLVSAEEASEVMGEILGITHPGIRDELSELLTKRWPHLLTEDQELKMDELRVRHIRKLRELAKRYAGMPAS